MRGWSKLTVSIIIRPLSAIDSYDFFFEVLMNSSIYLEVGWQTVENRDLAIPKSSLYLPHFARYFPKIDFYSIWKATYNIIFSGFFTKTREFGLISIPNAWNAIIGQKFSLILEKKVVDFLKSKSELSFFLTLKFLV